MDQRPWTLAIHLRMEVETDDGSREYFAVDRIKGDGDPPDVTDTPVISFADSFHTSLPLKLTLHVPARPVLQSSESSE